MAQQCSRQRMNPSRKEIRDGKATSSHEDAHRVCAPLVDRRLNGIRDSHLDEVNHREVKPQTSAHRGCSLSGNTLHSYTTELDLAGGIFVQTIEKRSAMIVAGVLLALQLHAQYAPLSRRRTCHRRGLAIETPQKTSRSAAHAMTSVRLSSLTPGTFHFRCFHFFIFAKCCNTKHSTRTW